jgi:hypothetical protein
MAKNSELKLNLKVQAEESWTKRQVRETVSSLKSPRKISLRQLLLRESLLWQFVLGRVRSKNQRTITTITLPSLIVNMYFTMPMVTNVKMLARIAITMQMETFATQLLLSVLFSTRKRIVNNSSEVVNLQTSIEIRRTT